MRSIVAASFLAAALGAGCAASAATGAYAPDLVTVSPGLQVIADYDEPIFYSDGFYWRYDGGVWYRSTYYTGGWAYARPPVAVMRIQQPTRTGTIAPPGGWVVREPATATPASRATSRRRRRPAIVARRRQRTAPPPRPLSVAVRPPLTAAPRHPPTAA